MNAAFQYLATIAFIVLPFRAFAQDLSTTNAEEIEVQFTVRDLGSITIPAVIDEDKVFVPILETFRFLRIRINVTVDLDTLSGFIGNQSNPFSIYLDANQGTIAGKEIEIQRSFFYRTESDVYMLIDEYKRLFDIVYTFNYRNLEIIAAPSMVLPYMTDLKREQIRKGIELEKEIKHDTLVARSWNAAMPGMLSWSFNAKRFADDRVSGDAGFSTGFEFMGGSLQSAVVYQLSSTVQLKNYMWNWKYIDNENTAVKQVVLERGNVPAKTFRSDKATIIGISNASTLRRQTYGIWRYNGSTEPGWMVELYINDKLSDFVKADPAGSFFFDIPLLYGTTDIRLEYYGPYGDIAVSEETLSVPYSFLPSGEIEYSAVAGVSEGNGNVSGSTKATVGISRYISFAGGLEYNEADHILAPSGTISLRPMNPLLVHGAFLKDYNAEFLLSWQFAMRSSFNFRMTRYFKRNSNPEYVEVEADLMFPSFMKSLPGAIQLYTLYTTMQNLHKYSSFVDYRGSFAGFQTSMRINYSQTISDSRLTDRETYVSGAIRRQFQSILFSTAFQHSIAGSIPSKIGVSAEKSIFTGGWAFAKIERIYSLGYTVYSAGVTINLGFSKARIETTMERESIESSGSAFGSIGFDPSFSRLITSSKDWIESAGIVVEPFLDINANGIRDQGEQRVKGLNVHVGNGVISSHEDDTLIYITGLGIGRHYLIECSPDGFDNISWQLPYKTLKVYTDPNQFKKVQIPIVPFGEIRGTVVESAAGSIQPKSGIAVIVTGDNGGTLARLVSDRYGEFYFLGLKPGKYRVSLDSDQLARLKCSSTSLSRSFEIEAKPDGDVIDDIRFTISPQ